MQLPPTELLLPSLLAPCRHAERQMHQGGGKKVCQTLTAGPSMIGVTQLCPDGSFHLLHKLQLPFYGSGL